jgi:AcrR family transcriptional regulator
MLRTAEQLTTVSRRLTAERGLSGFTVEELCEEVGISRRTFFNYFPSKEDAVIGGEQDEDLEHFAAEFLARGSRGWGAVIDDLLDLVIAQFERADINPESHAQLVAAIEREPKLLSRFLGAGRQRERQVAELIAERESVPATDPNAAAVVSLLATILRSGGEQYLDPTNTQTFGDILEHSLDAIRVVITQPTTRKAHA